MARVNTLLFLVIVALSVIALLDCVSTGHHRVRAFPRTAWALLIVCCPVAGPIAWFRAGRLAPGETSAPVAAPAFIGPEDDPDFVRMLADSLRSR
ncbi:PLD nuclease N-terminal domain-containing protein [Actinoplanes sp. NPDC051851]|uniref:PLD nuclease N-terminal domain-containing protein n=1 Tax=Actinoplanes sp. NPDC051851 TaxID=3154753 RepID=UPI0034498A49